MFEQVRCISLQERIGWRDAKVARRLIVAITDDEYHFALDGKISGLLKRNTASCNLDNTGLYVEERVQDYPSSYQLKEAFSDNSIIPIFAVTADQVALYEGLAEILESAFVGTITDDLSNFETVIIERYQVISRL